MRLRDINVRAALLGRQENRPWFAVAATLVYAVVIVVGHAHHEMWRDEVSCWMVGRDATGFWDLVTGDRRYEGHPFLWYYVLHLMSRVVAHHAILHVVTASAAIMSAFLWMRYAPLPRYARLLLLGSYYMMFEYAIIARGYGLGVMLTYLFCAVYQPYRIRYLRLSAILILLAATSLYGFVMACALTLFLFAHPFDFSWRHLKRAGWFRTRPGVPWFVGLISCLAGFLFTAVTTIPPKDAVFGQWVFQFDSNTVLFSLERYWRGMVPIVKSQLRYWGTNALLDAGDSALFTRNQYLMFAAGLLVAWCLVMARRPRLVLTYLIGVGVMVFFQITNYSGGIRHWGHYFIFLMACLWLFAKLERKRQLPWMFHPLFTLHVGALVVGGISAYSNDYQYPFSSALEAAQYLRSHGLAHQPIVGGRDAMVSSVIGMLDSKATFYSSETKQNVSHVVWHNRHRNIGPAQLLDDARRRLNETGQDIIVIATFGLGNRVGPGLRLEFLHETQWSTLAEEHYYIYRLKRAP